MWILIIILIAGIIIWTIASNNTDNEKIRNYNNKQGGLRSQFLNFSNILENKFNMNLKYDDGRKMCYQKESSIGELNIGVHLDFANYKIIYSKIIKKDGSLIKGQDVTYPIIDDIKLVEDCVNISIKNLMSEISQSDLKNQNVEKKLETPTKRYTKDWLGVIAKTNVEDELNFYGLYLFLKDDINPDVLEANLFYRKMGISHPEKFESQSIKYISLVPQIFSEYFISAYPDVYLWIQKNKIDISEFHALKKRSNNNLEYMSDLMDFYRRLIDQYLHERNKLECQNIGFKLA